MRTVLLILASMRCVSLAQKTLAISAMDLLASVIESARQGLVFKTLATNVLATRVHSATATLVSRIPSVHPSPAWGVSAVHVQSTRTMGAMEKCVLVTMTVRR